MKIHYWNRETFDMGTSVMVFRGIGISWSGHDWFIGIGRWTLEAPHETR